MNTPMATKVARDNWSAGPLTAIPEGGSNQYIATTVESEVVKRPGPSPPYQAASMIAGKN